MLVRFKMVILATALAVAPAAAQDMNTVQRASLLQSLQLPRITQESRLLGVTDRGIRDMFDMARNNHLAVADLTQLLQVENASIREHGPVDNFGAFVQARLNEGLRGNDLAAAIRAEHAAHGMSTGRMQRQNGHAGEEGELHGNPKKSHASKKVEPMKGKKGGSH